MKREQGGSAQRSERNRRAYIKSTACSQTTSVARSSTESQRLGTLTEGVHAREQVQDGGKGGGGAQGEARCGRVRLDVTQKLSDEKSRL